MWKEFQEARISRKMESWMSIFHNHEMHSRSRSKAAQLASGWVNLGKQENPVFVVLAGWKWCCREWSEMKIKWKYWRERSCFASKVASEKMRQRWGKRREIIKVYDHACKRRVRRQQVLLLVSKHFSFFQRLSLRPFMFLASPSSVCAFLPAAYISIGSK